MSSKENMFQGEHSTADALLRIRKRLLDLTTRNRLLSFRWTRGRTVRAVNSGLDDLYERLRDGGTFVFRPVPEPRRDEYDLVDSGQRKPGVAQFAEKKGIDISYELRPSQEGTFDHIQTLLYQDDLERVLRNIDRAARTAIEESGTNMLYMVFGFLEWYENENAQEPRYAPLITMPVGLKKIRHGHTFLYEAARTGEDIADNLTLREKLRQDFSLSLAEFDEESQPSIYFANVAQLARVKVEPPWRVSPQVTLCLLSFGNLLMYLDLDPARWPRGKAIHENQLVKALFEGTQSDPTEDVNPEDYPVEEDLRATRLPLIFDADSSQHSALVDAMQGRNLVVEGPPGTGKSQTITNLISAALATGKTVLFVSEKLAALEVVRDRLDRAGLGMFCLELHSHKTQKKEFLEDILLRLQSRGGFPNPQELDAKRRELEARRLRLKHYADLMNSVIHNELELTVHQVLWAAERHRRGLGDKVALLSAEDYRKALTCTREEYERLKEAVVQFQQHFLVIGENPQLSVWHGYYPYKLIVGDEPAVRDIVADLARSADDLASGYSHARQLTGLNLLPTRPAFEALRGQVRSLPALLGTETLDLLPEICAAEAVDAIRALEAQVLYVKERSPEIHRMLSSPERLTVSDLQAAKEALATAESLNLADTLLPKIRQCAKALRDLTAGVRKACEFLTATAARLNLNSVETREGLAAVWAAVQASRLAPLELLAYRQLGFTDHAAITALEEAHKEASSLQGEREVLASAFDMNLLPPREDLVLAVQAFRTSRGILRGFRSDWRRAARTYGSLSLKRRWFLGSRHCERDLRTLVAHLDNKTRFEADTRLRELLGNMFRGIETDFEAAKRLARWYAQTRQAFEEAHARIDFKAYLDLPAETIGWLASVTSECETHWGIVSNLEEHVRNTFGDEGPPLSLMTEAATLSAMRERLDVAATALEQIGNVLGGYSEVPASPRQVVTLIGEALSVAAVQAKIQNNERVRTLLKGYFQGVDTEFGPIRDVIQWSRSVETADVPREVKTFLLRPEAATNFPMLISVIQSLTKEWQGVDAATQAFDRFGTLDWDAWQQAYPQDAAGIRERAAKALEGFDDLWGWAGFSRARRRMEELGLSVVTNLALGGHLATQQISPAFLYLFHNSIARSILRDNPTLIEFAGLDHENLRAAFGELDREVIRLNGKLCAYMIDQRARTAPRGNASGPPRTYTELSLIAHEVQKKKGHVPIRQLVNRAGAALQALKPCFMMGPLSVAQYLGPGKLYFDMVVMDEASQLRPEEAIGALARSAQMVIVGDPKQLPPTPFFERFWEGDDSEEERGETAAGGMQSILDMSLVRFYPARTLRWHYRSQHESLIHFSNHHFYDQHLIVFPSPYGLQSGLGLRHHYVSTGLYENRRNVEEAKRVADAVIQHFLTRGEESLGVATLNIPQRDLIEEEIDRRLKLNPQAEEYITRWKSHGLMPFFVKNLESVQGDERDVIFISTTYGRNRQGGVLQNFGPINQADGWRRLNVLFTRARKRIELFTSLQPSDIVVDGNSPRGVRALRDYLAYVRDGIIEGPRVEPRQPDSDFEVAVADVLRNAGYEVVPQLGVAWFYIDIAVKNPSRPGEFIAAIECDGATYHSARSVRERDRIRQEILEGLGWKNRIYRIWSTDWFRDPNSQIKRLLAFVESAWEAAEAMAKARPEWKLEEITLPLPVEEISEAETFCVKVGDWVTYCDVEKPEDRKRVKITDGPPDPKRNIVGPQAPLAKALLGARIGDDVELVLKDGPVRMLRVLDID